jgi:hypothetical protein
MSSTPQLKTAVSIGDLASTGMTPKTSEATISFFARATSKVRDVASTTYTNVFNVVAATAGKVSEVAVSAKDAATSVGKGVAASAASGIDKVKAGGFRTVAFAKETYAKAAAGVSSRATATRSAIASVIDGAKTRAIATVSSTAQTILGYVPVSVKSNAIAAHEYANAKVSATHEAATSLVDNTRTAASAKVASAQVVIVDTIDVSKKRTAKLANDTQEFVLARTPTPVKSAASKTYTTVSTKATDLNTSAKALAADPKAQATAAGAAGGAVTLGATGGAVGLASGTVIGAAVGVVPALFTFGLSIPIGAMIGGGAGMCVGTAVGGTTGLVAGGAAGYKKDEISSGAKKAVAQAADCATSAKDRAGASRDFVFSKVTSSASYLRARVRMISGTGGTEAVVSESD